MKALQIKKDVYWVGALDPNLEVFDVIMNTPYGTTYNSYAIKGGEKTAIFETVKEGFFDEYIERLRSLDIKIEDIDYIIVNHTEPDHAGSVAKLLDISKNAKIVGSMGAIKFLKAIANRDFESIVVKDGDTLDLGGKTLKFILAPMLHWPDSIYTYLEEDKMLFTCDSFGTHYCEKNIFNDEVENQENYSDSLKYYFDSIMSPFKPYVLKAIKKIEPLSIDMICPGHGPVLRNNPWDVVELYKKWSTDNSNNTTKKIVICYVSAYGYTKSLANKVAEGIKSSAAKGDSNLKLDLEIYDAADIKIDDILKSISDADGIIFGSPTINADALKPIWEILISLNPIIHGKKYAAAFGSYGWSGEAVPNIESRLKQLRMNIVVPGLKVNFKPSEDELASAFDFGTKFVENSKLFVKSEI